MCHRTNRKYRCGCIVPVGINYCARATFSPRTGKKCMCTNPPMRSSSIVADESVVCQKERCWVNDIKNHHNGWTCCRCGEESNKMDACEGPPGGNGECPHQVCKHCNKTY